MNSNYLYVPGSIEAEEAIIGLALCYPEIFPNLSGVLKPDQFFIKRNEILWSVMSELNQQGFRVDSLVLITRLRELQLLENLGGSSYIMRLADTRESMYSAKTYVKLITTDDARRRILQLGDNIRIWSNDGLSIDELTARVLSSVYETAVNQRDEWDWKFVSIDEIKQRPIVKWLTAGKLPDRGLGMIYGPSGSFKSFLSLQWAIEVAEHAPVAYVLAEGADGMRSRIEAYEKHHNRAVNNLIFVDGSVDLFSKTDMSIFRGMAIQHQPKLIIFDTFGMSTGTADENSTRDMKQIVDQLRRVVNELGCFVMVVHHTNKEGRMERGNQSLRNACETAIRVTLIDDVVCIESMKSRDSAKFPTYYLKPVKVDLGYTDSLGQPASSLVLLPASQVMDSDDLTEQQRRVLEVLSVEPTASFTEIATSVEISRGAVSKIVKRLTDMGYVVEWDGKQ